MAEIDYYLFPLSPYAYLAGRKLEAVAEAHGARVAYKPFQLFRVFEATGTALPKDRHPSRKRYRLRDLARTARFEGLPINLQPAFWPTNPAPASAAIITAQGIGGGDLAGLVHGFLKAVWAEDRDIADAAVVRDILGAHGFDPALADRGLLAAMETLDRNTDEALARGVFGAPTYAIGEELFWGQDRLPQLERHLTELGGAPQEHEAGA